MNYREIYVQILKEYMKLRMSTVQRLRDEYDRERKKFKIKKENCYFKDYTIKTKGKNTWIFFFHKAPSTPRYKGKENVNFLGIVYYYDKMGLRVFSVNDDLFVTGYIGHFFKRYNERLGLNLSHPLDIVKTFFKNSGYTTADIVEKNNRLHAFGISREGLLLGEYTANPAGLEWKTFISKDLARHKQGRMEKQMVENLKAQIEAELETNTLDPGTFAKNKDVYLALTG